MDVPRTATVTATAPVRALVLTDQSFKSLLERSPQIQLKVLRSLAERLAPQSNLIVGFNAYWIAAAAL